jgi:hypothetical protein
MKKKSFAEIRGYVISAALFIIIVAAFVMTLTMTEQNTNDKFLQSKKDAVVKAVVSCYAIEGVYPPNVDYLREHYGLQVDAKSYIVHYEMFASNIMPDVDVFPRSGSRG